MEETGLKLSIVILTWNSLELLKRCIASIESSTVMSDYEMIIIDNNSAGDTRRFLQAIHSQRRRVIFNKRNLGVAPARNQGLRIARGRYILILDVDTIVNPGAIDTLVQYLDGDADCGIVAAKLTDADGNLQFTCRQFPTALSKLLRRIPFHWAQIALTNEEMRDWDHTSVRTVDYVIGACQMIRKDLLSDVGLLDDKIFYGPEDVDYCLRAWQHNYGVVYNPNAHIIHDEQRITREKLLSKITLAHLKGLAHYFLKHRYLFSRKRLYQRLGKSCPLAAAPRTGEVPPAGDCADRFQKKNNFSFSGTMADKY